MMFIIVISTDLLNSVGVVVVNVLLIHFFTLILFIVHFLALFALAKANATDDLAETAICALCDQYDKDEDQENTTDYGDRDYN